MYCIHRTDGRHLCIACRSEQTFLDPSNYVESDIGEDVPEHRQLCRIRVVSFQSPRNVDKSITRFLYHSFCKLHNRVSITQYVTVFELMSLSSTVFTIPLTPMNSLPTAAFGNFANETLSIANGTRLDCTELVAGEDIINMSTNTTISSCNEVAAGYNVSTSDFISWNPSLNSSSPCVLQPKLQYCVQRMVIAPPQKATPYCLRWSVASPGYTCSNFTISRGVHPDRFTEWNPSVGTGCKDWKTGLSIITFVAFPKAALIV